MPGRYRTGTAAPPTSSLTMTASWRLRRRSFDRVTRRPGLRAAALLTLALVAVGVGIPPARAVPGRLAPVRDSYEPGERATLVGYTGGPTFRGVPAAPFHGYLRVAGGDVPLGRLALEETGHTGFLALRVRVTFDVPLDLEPGEYEVWYCDDPCTRAPIGDLGPSPLAIATEPSRPVARQWAFDEPEIANLAPDALIVGPDFEATADDVRAGRVAPPPEPPPTTAPAPSPAVAPPAPAEVTPVASSPPRVGKRWHLTTALSLVAAAATWVVLAWREQACAPEPASRRPTASADGRSAAAGRG